MSKQNNLIKRGNIFKLGEHLLLCGDAREKALIDDFLKRQNLDLVLTDPPYGIDYVGSKDWQGLRGPSGEAKYFSKHRVIKGDERQNDENYDQFTQKWIESCKDYLNQPNAFYIFNSEHMILSLMQGMKYAGLHFAQLIIWIKQAGVLGRKDYIHQHELIAYGWRGKHKFYRGKGRGLILYPRPQRSILHPTMKPVGLLRKLILNSTKIGATVYDPFGGSGSTLIACENTKRKCLMVEIEPEYCKTIIDRWEKLTKLKAEKLSTA